METRVNELKKEIREKFYELYALYEYEDKDVDREKLLTNDEYFKDAFQEICRVKISDDKTRNMSRYRVKFELLLDAVLIVDCELELSEDTGEYDLIHYEVNSGLEKDTEKGVEYPKSS